MREVDLGGRTVEVHYGAKAMRAIERECGCSWIKLADKAANDELLLQDIVVIVWGGLLKARRGVTVEQVADMLGDDLRTVYTVGNACMEEMYHSMKREIALPDGAEEDPSDEGKN